MTFSAAMAAANGRTNSRNGAIADCSQHRVFGEWCCIVQFVLAGGGGREAGLVSRPRDQCSTMDRLTQEIIGISLAVAHRIPAACVQRVEHFVKKCLHSRAAAMQ